MTDDEDGVIEDYEPVRWSEVVWFCPECSSVLGPLGDSDFNRERSGEEWWEDPEQWGDEPAVVCQDCEIRFAVEFEPVGRDEEE